MPQLIQSLRVFARSEAGTTTSEIVFACAMLFTITVIATAA